MKIIQTEKMPPANGHYSQCIEHNGLLYLSGQLPIEPLTKKIPDGIAEQTKLVLRKIELITNEAGSSINQILQMRIYISDIELWDTVNDIYSDFFGSHKPVRCIVPTGKLHYGCLVEVEAIAHL
jgi:2-iminobutanoate/2-iminopropanoate deaminase